MGLDNSLGYLFCMQVCICCIFRLLVHVLQYNHLNVLGFLVDKAPPGTARRKRRSESRRQFADSASSRPSPRGFGSRNQEISEAGVRTLTSSQASGSQTSQISYLLRNISAIKGRVRFSLSYGNIFSYECVLRRRILRVGNRHRLLMSKSCLGIQLYYS